MIGGLRLLARDTRASSAVEMALVVPLLLIIMLGSVELGNYFLNEHTLVKAVRDGARFASRQSFASYPDCSTVDSTAQADIKNVVKYGYLSGTNVLTPNIVDADITISTSCSTTAGGQSMSGIYRGRTVSGVATGAQIVTVNASVDYRSVLGSFGFSGVGLHLNASSQAAVAGI
jgi:Flp pilus assembly protein TadG